MVRQLHFLFFLLTPVAEHVNVNSVTFGGGRGRRHLKLNSLKLNSEVWNMWCPGGTSVLSGWSSQLQNSSAPSVIDIQCFLSLFSVRQVLRA